MPHFPPKEHAGLILIPARAPVSIVMRSPAFFKVAPGGTRNIGGRMVDSQESNLRLEIVSVCRKLDQKGLIPVTGGNVSCRVGPGFILITPGGIPKADIKPEDLVLTDLNGTPAGAPDLARKPSSEIGMHLGVYRERPDVQAVVHAHPPVATAFTLVGFPFPAKTLPEAWVMLGRVPTAPYATPSTDEVARSLAPYLKGNRAILMKRHGAITFGKTVMEAFTRMEELEHSSKIIFYAALMERRNSPPAMAAAEIEKLDIVFGTFQD